MPDEEDDDLKTVIAVVSGGEGEESEKGNVRLSPGTTAYMAKKKTLESLAEAKGKDPNSVKPREYELYYDDDVLSGDDNIYDIVDEQEKIRLQPDLSVATTPSLPSFLLYISTALIILLIFLVKRILSKRPSRNEITEDGSEDEQSNSKTTNEDQVKKSENSSRSDPEDIIVEWENVGDEPISDDKTEIPSTSQGDSNFTAVVNGGDTDSSFTAVTPSRDPDSDFDAVVRGSDTDSSFTAIVPGEEEGFRNLTEHQLLAEEKGWNSFGNGVYRGQFKISNGNKCWFGEGEKAGDKYKLFICLPEQDYKAVKNSKHSACFTKRKDTPKGKWCEIHFNGNGTTGGKPKKLSDGITEIERYLKKIFDGGGG